MIPENREQREIKNPEQECINFIMSYLRDNMSPAAMLLPNMRAAIVQRVTLTAKDWCLKRGMQWPAEKYQEVAKRAVNTYIKNWSGKQQGVDDRGHRLGKGW